MPNLEGIVRPLQSLETTPPRRVLEVRKYVSPVKLRIGTGGSGKTVDSNYKLSAKWYQDTSVSEVSQR